MLYLGVEIFGGEILGACVEAVGMFGLVPSLFVVFYAFGAEVIGNHVCDSCQPPFCYVLTSAATNVKDMQKRIVSAFQIQGILYLFAHFFGLGLNQNGLDPIVEGFELECSSVLSFMFTFLFFSVKIVVFLNFLFLFFHHYLPNLLLIYIYKSWIAELINIETILIKRVFLVISDAIIVKDRILLIIEWFVVLGDNSII